MFFAREHPGTCQHMLEFFLHPSVRTCESTRYLAFCGSCCLERIPIPLVEGSLPSNRQIIHDGWVPLCSHRRRVPRRRIVASTTRVQALSSKICRNWAPSAATMAAGRRHRGHLRRRPALEAFPQIGSAPTADHSPRRTSDNF